MYDTINMYYNLIDNPSPSVEKLFEHCNNKSEHYNVKNDSSYVQGDLRNMKVTLNESSISVKGSLCKYFYGNNIDTLNLTTTREALNQISADLSIDIHKASVSRIYYPYLGQLSRFERYEQPNSIYYNQQAKRLLFYDKIEEAKKKGMTIPKQHIGDNLLRYELVLNKGISRYLKYNGLYVQDLGSEELFKKLLHLWYSYYQQIQKHSKQLNPMTNNINNPKTALKELLEALIRKNPETVDHFCKRIKEEQLFKHKEYYSRLNSRIRKIHQAEVVENPLIDELSSKIEDIYIELM